MRKRTYNRKTPLTEAEKFQKRYAVKDINQASQEELAAAVRKAAKAANQRLLRLERAGYTGGVYKTAMRNIAYTKSKRFKERTTNLDVKALRREYVAMRDFLTAQTSTVQGTRDADVKRYETALERGYEGTLDEFRVDIARAFSDAIKSIYDSNTIYNAVKTGTVDLLEETVKESKARDKPMKSGNILVAYLEKKKGK